MSPLDYDFKREQARARQDVDSLASAVNLWLAIGLLDMAKPKPSRVKVSRQAASIRAYLAAGVMCAKVAKELEAEAERREDAEYEALRQESRLEYAENSYRRELWMI